MMSSQKSRETSHIIIYLVRIRYGGNVQHIPSFPIFPTTFEGLLVQPIKDVQTNRRSSEYNTRNLRTIYPFL